MRTTGARIRVFPKALSQLISPFIIRTDEFESAPAESGDSNALGMGRSGVADDEDPWAAFEDPAPPPVPIPVTELTSPPVPSPPTSVVAPVRTLAAQAAHSPRVSSHSPSSSPRLSHAPSERAKSLVASPPSVPSTAGMTKEEKAAEMARRKEERKQVCHFHCFVTRHSHES
jgi:hypothetical protein